MGDRVEFVDPAGARRSCEVPEGTVFLRVAGDELLCSAEPAGASLRIVPTSRGRRLEPVRPGGTVVVGGSELFCKDLAPGDAFVVDGLRATWRGGGAVAESPRARTKATAARPAREREPAGSPTPRVAARPRPATPKGLVVSAVSLAVLLAVVALRWLDTQVGQHGPDELLTFARIQFESGQFDRALRTIEEAESKAAGDAAIQQAAARLREDLRRTQRDLQRSAAVRKAQEELDGVRSFADRYGASGLERPAARAVVRRCEEWEREHAAALRGFADGDRVLAEAAALRARAEPSAAMGTPDTAQDVVFSARAHLRFLVREYKAAVGELEAFLRAHPGDETAQRELAAIRSEAAEWIATQRKSMTDLFARGEHDNVRRRLAQIDERALLPEHAALLADLRAQLAQPGDGSPR